MTRVFLTRGCELVTPPIYTYIQLPNGLHIEHLLPNIQLSHVLGYNFKMKEAILIPQLFSESRICCRRDRIVRFLATFDRYEATIILFNVAREKNTKIF